MRQQSESRALSGASDHYASNETLHQKDNQNEMGPANELDSWVGAIRQQQSLKELFELSARFARDLGYDFFAINEQGLTVHERRAIVFSNYPGAWLQTLEESQLWHDDPVQRAATTTHGSFTWSELGDLIKLEPRDLAYIEMAKSQGIRSGLTIPFHTPNQPSGVISFASGNDGPMPNLNRAQSIYIAGEIYKKAVAIRREASGTQDRIRLTRRQKQCVTYLANGHTIEETAAKLGISRHSVKSHIESSGKTLGARRLPQIVARAIYYRQIELSELA